MLGVSQRAREMIANEKHTAEQVIHTYSDINARLLEQIKQLSEQLGQLTERDGCSTKRINGLLNKIKELNSRIDDNTRVSTINWHRNDKQNDTIKKCRDDIEQYQEQIRQLTEANLTNQTLLNRQDALIHKLNTELAFQDTSIVKMHDDMCNRKRSRSGDCMSIIDDTQTQDQAPAIATTTAPATATTTAPAIATTTAPAIATTTAPAIATTTAPATTLQ
jgi:chromosome segregation ATPase